MNLCHAQSMKDQVEIRKDDLSDGQVVGLLEMHRAEMLKHLQ